MNGTEMEGEDASPEFPCFPVDIRVEHFLIGKSDIFQEKNTVEQGFSRNSANISFCPFALLSSGNS